jgi:hypothetical protein
MLAPRSGGLRPTGSLSGQIERGFRPTPMAHAVLLLFLGVAGALLWQGRVLVQRARRLGGAP